MVPGREHLDQKSVPVSCKRDIEETIFPLKQFFMGLY